MDLVYLTLKRLFSLLTTVFFREVVAYGSDKIPKHGPVIFVVAPHANQFVDPMLLTRSCRGRQIRFLMAASSLRKWFIGFFGRLLNSIPVERPIDLAKRGQGMICLRMNIVTGFGTAFLADIPAHRTCLYVKKGIDIITLNVERVLSDSELLVKASEGDLDKTEYFIGPYVDNSLLYENVFRVLSDSGTIGIFPEGGSHDRSSMLPLKAGAAVMALGTSHCYPGVDVKIVPCGLNYFNPDKFRSKAVVEFGDPISATPELLTLYSKGSDSKRQAISQLLQQIFDGLQKVTINLPDYETYQLIHTAKDLYKSSSVHYHESQELELMRRMGNGVIAKLSDPKIQQLRDKLVEYRRLLRIHSLRDEKVRLTSLGKPQLILAFASNLLNLLLSLLLIVPSFILMGPFLVLADVLATRKAKHALASSVVKIKAKDVIATWKIIYGAIFLLIADLVWTLFGSYIFFHAINWMFIFASLLFLIPLGAFLGIRALEKIRSSMATIKPSLLALKNPKGAYYLRAYRHEIRKSIQRVIDEYGPQVLGEDFHENRIVRRRKLSCAHDL